MRPLVGWCVALLVVIGAAQHAIDGHYLAAAFLAVLAGIALHVTLSSGWRDGR